MTTEIPAKTIYGSVVQSKGAGITTKIESCVVYKDKILQLFFQEKVKSDDVTELIQTAQKVETILKYFKYFASDIDIFFRKIEKNQYLQSVNPNSLSLKIFQRTLDKLELVCADYHAELVKIDASGQLPKVLSNTNQRKKIEQFNSLFLVEATNLEEKCEYLAKVKEKLLIITSSKEIKNFSASSSGVRVWLVVVILIHSNSGYTWDGAYQKRYWK
jgi:hypothetical protein